MIFCSNCGNSIHEEAAFCPECGAKSETTSEQTSSVSNEIESTAATIIHKPNEIDNNLIDESPLKPKQYCRNCGNEIEPGAFACMKCGLPPMKAFNFCYNCGANCHNDAIVCIKCGVSLESQSDNPKIISHQEKEQKHFCRNCGKEVSPSAVACLNCGLPPRKSKNFCPSCGFETHNDAVICVKCGVGLEQFAVQRMQQALEIQNTDMQSAFTQIKHSNTQINNTNTQNTNVIVAGKQKSVGTAFVLALFLGPIGLMYASPIGGLIMLLINVLLLFILPIIGLILVWIICIIWAVNSAQNANSSMLDKAGNVAAKINNGN